MSRFRVDLRSDTVTLTVAADARGDGRCRGRRRLVRRRSDREPAAGARRRATRQASGPVRADRHDGQPDRARAACAHAAGISSPARARVARGHDRGDDVGGAVGHRVPHARPRLPRAGSTPTRPGRCSSPTPTTTSRSSTCSASRTPSGGAGGRVMPLDELRAVRKVADEAGVPVHLDGARLFNAAVAAGVDVAELAGTRPTRSCSASRRGSVPRSARCCADRPR